MLALIPPEIASLAPLVERGPDYKPPSTLKGSELTVWNSSDVFNITMSGQVIEKTYGQVDVQFRSTPFTIHSTAPALMVWDVGPTVFGWPLWYHAMFLEGGQISETQAYNVDLDNNYNEDADSSSFRWYCEHITVKVTLRSADNVTDLRTTWIDGGNVTVVVNYEIDFEAMGMNIWGVLMGLFTFTTVQTGQPYLDLLFNAMISVPIYVGVVYCAYRIIAGVIPTISGGGSV